MSTPSYRALRAILGVMSAFTVAGGLLVILVGKPLLMRMLLSPPESEVSSLLVSVSKEMGGILILVGVMLFFAARDPVRNVAIIDGMIAGCCVLTITPLVSLYTLDLGALYPAWMIWGRAIARLVVAGVLFYLRPRSDAAQQA